MNKKYEPTETLTVSQFAEALGLRVSTIYNWIEWDWIESEERESTGGRRKVHAIPASELARVIECKKNGKAICSPSLASA